MGPEVSALAASDQSENDNIDTLIANELFSGRVDVLITEDRGIHRKARKLSVGERVFTIDSFLEKVNAENPDLVDYKVLAVQKSLFGDVNPAAPFFDTFREDYGGIAFDRWFNRKADEVAYLCNEGPSIVAFLFLKVEDATEYYGDIEPAFRPKRRLKIGTFKVELNGRKLGERFLKIVFDNAFRQNIEEIYVTIFPRTAGQQRLIKLLEDFGFSEHGFKTSQYGKESVYVRDMIPAFDASDPKLTFPYISRSSRAFIVPIKPEYHTSLLPDSILNNESPEAFVEQEPYRNAISKVYISRSRFSGLKKGDIVVFYRTGGYHKSVVTTIGIIDGVYRNVRDEDQFISLCRKRSVFSDKELREQWNWRSDRPFIVGFLYAYSFPREGRTLRNSSKMELLETLNPHHVASNKFSGPNLKQSLGCAKRTHALLSIKPPYAEAIFRGEKRFEFRRAIFRRPVDVVVVYITSPVCRVVGEFDVKEILSDEVRGLWSRTSQSAGIGRELFFDYFLGCSTAHAISIGEVRRYTQPLDLASDFGVKAPQSFLYLECSASHSASPHE